MSTESSTAISVRAVLVREGCIKGNGEKDETQQCVSTLWETWRVDTKGGTENGNGTENSQG